MKTRLQPFLALLDARYAPLLFLVLPQAYTVFLWLVESVPPQSPYKTAAFIFAVIGGIAYEFASIGAISWTEAGKVNRWSIITAITSLVFSMLIAVKVYEADQWAWLHCGNALVAFFYTLSIFDNAPIPERSSTKNEDDMAPYALALRKQGKSFQQIADTLELSKTAAFRLIQDAERPKNGVETPAHDF